MKVSGHTMGTPELNVIEAVELFASIGLEGIEIVVQEQYKSGLSPDSDRQEIQAVKKAAGQAGLEVVCLTPYFSLFNALDESVRRKEIEGLKRVIAQAEQLSTSYIRIYSGKFHADEDDHGNEKRKRLVESMQILGERAASAGVTLVMENHFNTMTVTAKETSDILAEINHPAVKALYDQANLTFAGAEAYKEAIALQSGRIGLVHVKDLVFREGKGPFRASSVSHVSEDERTVYSRVIGQGMLPWPDILQTLLQHGYDGWLSMEYERRWHSQDLPLAGEGMAEGAAYLRECLKKLGASN